MTVLFYGTVLDYTAGEKLAEVSDAPTVRALIDALGERFGGRFKEFLLEDGACFFLVNGSGLMATGGLETPLCAEDKVEVLPFVDAG